MVKDQHPPKKGPSSGIGFPRLAQLGKTSRWHGTSLENPTKPKPLENPRKSQTSEQEPQKIPRKPIKTPWKIPAKDSTKTSPSSSQVLCEASNNRQLQHLVAAGAGDVPPWMLMEKVPVSVIFFFDIFCYCTYHHLSIVGALKKHLFAASASRLFSLEAQHLKSMCPSLCTSQASRKGGRQMGVGQNPGTRKTTVGWPSQPQKPYLKSVLTHKQIATKRNLFQGSNTSAKVLQAPFDDHFFSTLRISSARSLLEAHKQLLPSMWKALPCWI